MHFTLTPRFNRLLLLGYCAVLVVVIALIRTRFLPTFGAAILLGASLGYIQSLAIRGAQGSLIASATAMDVRRALTSTVSGRRYIQLLWVSFVVISVLALTTSGRSFPACLLGGLAGLWLVRDVVTYRDMAMLSKLGPPGPGPSNNRWMGP